MTMIRIARGFLLVFISVSVFCVDIPIAKGYIIPAIRNFDISPKISNQSAMLSYEFSPYNVQTPCDYGQNSTSFLIMYSIDGGGFRYDPRVYWSSPMNYWYQQSINLGIFSPGSHSIKFGIFSSVVRANGGTSMCYIEFSPINFSIADHSIPPINGACSIPAVHSRCSYGLPTNERSMGNAAGMIYNWTCQGLYGGTDKSCTELVGGGARVINGSCSLAGYRCASGAAGNFSYSNGIYAWSCYGSNGGSSTSCSKATTPPVVNSVSVNTPVRVDGLTRYTVTSIATDLNATDNITDQLVRINYQGINAGMDRGYFGWSKDSEFSFFSGTYKSDPILCSGGGSAVIYGNGYGLEHLNLISCSTDISPLNPNERTVRFVVTFNPSFTVPLTNNTLSGYAYSKSTLLNSGWISSGIFDIFIPLPVPTVDLKINGSDGPVPLSFGDTRTITWTSTNATSCIASSEDGFAGSKAIPSGSQSIPASVTSRHRLTCSGPGGNASDSVQVDVSCVPVTGVYGACDCSTGMKTRMNTLATCLPSVEMTDCDASEKNVCRDYNWKEIAP